MTDPDAESTGLILASLLGGDDPASRAAEARHIADIEAERVRHAVARRQQHEQRAHEQGAEVT
jgi:hypothetical protein